jgi:hypothetical protein
MVDSQKDVALATKIHSPEPSTLGYTQPDPKNLEVEEVMYLLDDLMT